MADADAMWSRPLRLAWLVAAVVLCSLWGLGTAYRLQASAGFLQDFAQEWISGRAALSGHPVYPPLSEAVPRYFGADWKALHVVYNGHPPASVLLTLPLALLDYRTAYLAWNGLSLLALGLAVWWIVRPRGLGLSPWLLLPVATLLVTGNALAQQINQGQWNLVLLLLLVAAWSAWRRDRPLEAGALVGLAGALKLFPLFLLLPLAVRRQWRGLACGLLTFLAVNAAAAAVLGPESFRDYVGVVLPSLVPYRDLWMNASVIGLWSKLFVGASGHVEPLAHSPLVARLGTLASAGVIAVAAGRYTHRAAGLPGRDLAFAVCVIAMLLLTPVTWDHSFLLLLLPLLVIWRYSRPRSAGRVAVVVAALGLGVMNPRWLWGLAIPGPGELAPVAASVAEPWQVVTVLSLQLYLLLGLFAVALAASRRSASRPGAEWPVSQAGSIG